MRELQSLNEIWDYRAAEGPWDKREIPYADRRPSHGLRRMPAYF